MAVGRRQLQSSSGNIEKHASYYIEVELLRGRGFTLGLGCGAGPHALDVEEECDEQPGFWGVCDYDGSLCHDGYATAWAGQEGFGSGDTVGLLLLLPRDTSSSVGHGNAAGPTGSLTMFKNGKEVGLVLSGSCCCSDVGGGVTEEEEEAGALLFQRGATAGLCWAIGLGAPGASVRIVHEARPPLPSLEER
eukprot:COSAG05_NODE_2375_length_3158_cov_53.744688_2_plen_191_part_00